MGYRLNVVFWRRCGFRTLATFTPSADYAANGVDDTHITGTATKVATQFDADALVVDLIKPFDDIARCNQHARGAKSALESMFGSERLS